MIVYYCLVIASTIMMGQGNKQAPGKANGAPLPPASGRTLSLDGCQPVFKASWWDFPPYATQAGVDNSNRSTTNSVISPLHRLVVSIVDHCCGAGSRVEFNQSWSNMFEMTEGADDDTFKFPYSLSGPEKQFVHLGDNVVLNGILSPGAFYLVPKLNKSPLIGVLESAWPLLVIIVAASLLAGTVIWALERRQNNEQFPKVFKTGIIEGVWWAFVSMTTVGYGDKTPTSFLARLFGILWILFGVCIMSVFTSIITTALSSSQNTVNHITYKKVAVLDKTFDFVVALGESSIITACKDRNCLKSALLQDDLDGILLDQYAAAFQKSGSPNFLQDFDVAWKSNVFVNHGVLVTQAPTELKKCFSVHAAKQSPALFKKLMASLYVPAKSSTGAASVASDLLTNGNGTIFWIGTGLFCLIVLVICISLAVIEKVMWRQKVEHFVKVQEVRTKGLSERKF